MFKENREMEREIRNRMKGGEGQATITHIFKQGEYKGKARLFAVITLEPKSSIGFHRHENEEEIFYFTKGEGKVVDEDQELTVHPGDALLTGFGRGHSVVNTGNEVLEFVALILV